PRAGLSIDATTVAPFRYSGSNSMPMPGVVGTLILPSTIRKSGVYHVGFCCGARQGYSMYGPVFFVHEANWRMFTDVAPVCVLWGTIVRPSFSAMRATRLARIRPPL